MSCAFVCVFGMMTGYYRHRTRPVNVGHAIAVWYRGIRIDAPENENGRGIEPVRLQL